jgi:hypothetical protein
MAGVTSNDRNDSNVGNDGNDDRGGDADGFEF